MTRDETRRAVNDVNNRQTCLAIWFHELVIHKKKFSQQTTNYGLAGVCQTHHDPGGYIMTRPKAKPSSEDAAIGANGDIFMTIMGWLNNVPAGGGTAFDHPQKGCSNVLKEN